MVNGHLAHMVQMCRYSIERQMATNGFDERWLRPLTFVAAAPAALVAGEAEARRDVDPLTGRYWLVVNLTTKARGEAAAYRLVPLGNGRGRRLVAQA